MKPNLLLRCFLLLCFVPWALCVAQSRPMEQLNRFSPSAGFFSISLPAGWELSEDDYLASVRSYFLKAYAPGYEGLGYLALGADYYAAPSRTAERYVYDLQHPSPEAPLRGDRLQLQVGGRSYIVIEDASERSLPGMDERVKARKRWVVLPEKDGFFVLWLDAPAAHFNRVLPTFEAVLSSFKSSTSGNALLGTLRDASLPPDEVSAEDYEVYAGFMSWKAQANSALPPYFEDALSERSVLDRTSFPAGGDPVPAGLLQDVGQSIRPLWNDLLHKNSKPRQVRDRIMVPYLNVVSEVELRNRLGEEAPLTVYSSGYLAFSIPGYDTQQTQALLYVGHSGNPTTGYYVLMRKQDRQWTVQCAWMAQMLIR